MSYANDTEEILFFLAEHWIPVRQMLRTMSRGDSLTADIFCNCLVREFRVPARLVPALRQLLLECCRYSDIVHTETLRHRIGAAKQERLEAEFGADPMDAYFKHSSPRTVVPPSIPKPPPPSSTMRGTVGNSKSTDYHTTMTQFRAANGTVVNAAPPQAAESLCPPPAPAPAPHVVATHAAAVVERPRSASSHADSLTPSARAAEEQQQEQKQKRKAAAATTSSLMAAAAQGQQQQQQQQMHTQRQIQLRPHTAFIPRNAAVPTTMLSSSHRGCTPKVDLGHRREALRAQFLKATGGIAVVTRTHFAEALDSITPWPVSGEDFDEIYDSVRRADGKVHVDDFCHRFCEEYVQNSSSFAASMRPCFALIGKSPRYRHGAIGEKVTGGPMSGGGGGSSAAVKAPSLLPPANPRAAVVAKTQRDQEERERLARRVVRLTRASELRKEVGALFRKTVDSYDGYLTCGILPSPRRPLSAHMVSIGSAGVVTGTVHLPNPPLPTRYHRINTKIEADATLLGNVKEQ